MARESGKKDEKKAEKKKYRRHQVLYDNIALLNPAKKGDLINTNAVLDVYCKEPETGSPSISDN